MVKSSIIGRVVSDMIIEKVRLLMIIVVRGCWILVLVFVVMVVGMNLIVVISVVEI